MTRWKLVGWIGVAAVLVGLAIPWFLWDDRTTLAGVPLWVWWHAAWLLLSAVAFHRFATTAWGIGIEPDGGRPGPPSPGSETEPGAASSDGNRGGEPGGGSP